MFAADNQVMKNEEEDTRVGSLSFLQGIFPTQGLNPGFLGIFMERYQTVCRKWKGNNADSVYSVGVLGRSAGFHFNTKVVLVTTGDKDLGVIR